jgi:UDP-glucose 4-epimerase
MLGECESMLSGRRVLITGGLGFIGSNLARKLVELGADVTLVDSLIPEYGGNLFNITGIENEVKVNISDVRDQHSMKYLVQDKDYLFNLAGQTSHLDSMQDPFIDLDINAKSQLYILEACRQYNADIKIVFASTRQIYGKPRYLPVDEDHPLSPVDINGVNKLAGEWYHLLYDKIHGIRTCVLRLTNTIGPRMRVKDGRQTFVGIWIRLLLEGKPFEVWGGKQVRDFTYVDDCVEAMLLAACNEKANGQIFNLGGDQTISLKDLADLLVELNGAGEYIIREFPEERQKIDIGDYYSGYHLIQKTLGWAAKVDLQEALRGTLEFYKEHLNQYV